jgi:HAD superfamily hydrolase (TIGR01509 family)
MGKPYGLIFDVDGVIADTEAINARASIEMFDELLNLKDVKPADFRAGLGRGAVAYVRAAASVHGLELTDAQVEAATTLRQKKFLKILEAEPLPPFEGVIELITAAFNRDDFRLAIATSGTREKSEAVLKSAKIPYQKMTYITGSDIVRKKPAPDLFLAATEKAGVDPQNSVVVEDAPDGVAAAKVARCKCIAVTNSTTPEKLTQADLIVDTLAKVTIKTIVALLESD